MCLLAPSVGTSARATNPPLVRPFPPFIAFRTRRDSLRSRLEIEGALGMKRKKLMVALAAALGFVIGVASAFRA
jgi:hypothetical protein